MTPAGANQQSPPPAAESPIIISRTFRFGQALVWGEASVRVKSLP